MYNPYIFVWHIRQKISRCVCLSSYSNAIIDREKTMRHNPFHYRHLTVP